MRGVVKVRGRGMTGEATGSTGGQGTVGIGVHKTRGPGVKGREAMLCQSIRVSTDRVDWKVGGKGKGMAIGMAAG
jgi:hypothetical protein